MIEKEFENKTILITGAAGSIGSELSALLLKYKVKLILLDQAESALYDLEQKLKRYKLANFKLVIADVSNSLKMDAVFKKYSPDIVFHTAAYKHVPLMEDNPDQAIRVNVLGTKIVSDLSVIHNVRTFVMISTDKAVNPTSVMGASKRLAELYIEEVKKQVKTKFVTLRFGNVLNSNGSIIPLLKKQLQNNQSLTITHLEVSRFFITIEEVCDLIINATILGKKSETYLFEMGKPIKIIDLAKKIIEEKGLENNDVIIETIGLRVGEKLKEELVRTDEIIETTRVKKILKINNLHKKEISNFKLAIEELCILYATLPAIELVARIKNIIPEYITNNPFYKS